MRTKDQLLLEEAYEKILFSHLIQESHTENETDSENDEEDSENDEEDSENDEKVDNEEETVKSEKFIHGIQPIVEAKKKVNPYAVCTATVGRKDESKYKSCKEKVAKGAKKAGKKVTTEKVKSKKKK